jgi:3-polyprenyl-4-hydroxybenzoate decarboxylase
METYYLGLASERFSSDDQKTLPKSSTCIFRGGIFTTRASCRSTSATRHARKIMNAFWGLGQLMFSKTIVVVDKTSTSTI